MKYPIGIQTFEKIRESGFVYVDKTEFVYNLVHDGKIYFLGRPRRFGKSLLISTLESYFLGRRDLFKGLAIEKLEAEWNSYPVFHIDFNAPDYTRVNALENSLVGYVKEWEAKYGVVADTDLSVGERFAKVLSAARQATGLRCVVLVDEYDKPLLDVLDTQKTIEVEGSEITLEENNRNVLKSFYSTFKKADADLQFVFLTGVTKFSQISVFSGFNQPKDISMDARYDTLCGITDEEIDSYFSQSIADMAEAMGIGPDDIRKSLKQQFDGYHFSVRLKGVYNPFSLLNALDSKDICDYWFSTGTPTYLVRLLRHCNENLDELTGKYYEREQFVDYRATVQQPLPMLFQSGYLTIKAYNERRRKYLLDFPNDEVKKGFVVLVANNYLGLEGSKDIRNLAGLMADAFDEGNMDKLRDILTSFFASIPYSVRRRADERDKERDFQYTFYLILRLLSTYVTYIEKQQSQGRVDCVVETPDHVFIFEFKLDGTAQQALDQIDNMGYAQEYAADARPVSKIGCNFSSSSGTIDDWVVE